MRQLPKHTLVSSAVSRQLSGKQDKSDILTLIGEMTDAGLLALVAAGQLAARAIIAGSEKITVTDGDGVAGNPTIDLGDVASTDLTDSDNLPRLGAAAVFEDSVTSPLFAVDDDFYCYIDGGEPFFYFGVNTFLVYDRIGKSFYLSVDGTVSYSFDANQNLILSGMSAAAGVTRGVHIRNGNTPTGNPSGGVVVYAEAGALKCRGSGGTVTTLAPA
jgi:hypothetical protein